MIIPIITYNAKLKPFCIKKKYFSKWRKIIHILKRFFIIGLIISNHYVVYKNTILKNSLV